MFTCVYMYVMYSCVFVCVYIYIYIASCSWLVVVVGSGWVSGVRAAMLPAARPLVVPVPVAGGWS